MHKSETKPFNPHAAHAATPSNQPWFDLTGLPSPNRAADLGAHRYEITAANEEARAFFKQGLIYAYGFNHLEALRAFRQAQTLDPDCAMCFWGEAYVLGSNLNLPMEAAAAPIARAAAEKAVARAGRTSAREQALAAAMVVRYAEPGERADLDQKYAEAMQGVAKSFETIPTSRRLPRNCLCCSRPGMYSVDLGRTPKEHTTQALRLLEGALAEASRPHRRNPFLHSPRRSLRPPRTGGTLR